MRICHRDTEQNKMDSLCLCVSLASHWLTGDERGGMIDCDFWKEGPP